MHGTFDVGGDLRPSTRRDNGTGAVRRHLRRRRLTLNSVALCAAAALLLAGCGSDENGAEAGPASGSWSDIVAAAEKEGKVTVYSGQGTKQLQDLAAKFQQKYPKIKVEIVRGVETDFIPKLEAEARTGKGIADIAAITDRAWMSANKDNFEAPRGEAFNAPEYNKAENLLENAYFVIDAAALI